MCECARVPAEGSSDSTKGSRADAIPHGDLIRALSYGCALKAQLTYGSSTAITDSLR